MAPAAVRDHNNSKETLSMKRILSIALLASLLAAPAIADELTGKLKSIAASKTILRRFGI